MSNTTDQNTELSESQEVHIETSSADRTFRTIIWVVEVEGTLYVRSYLGPRGKWYQRALANPAVALTKGSISVGFTASPAVDLATIDAVSDAFVAKYPPGRSLDAMIAPGVLDTTLRLDPA